MFLPYWPLSSPSLLKPGTEVSNPGMVMAIYLSLADKLREYFEADDENPDFSRFDHVLAYAEKYTITPQGPSKNDELIKAIEEDWTDAVKLFAPSADRGNWPRPPKLMPETRGRFSSYRRRLWVSIVPGASSTASGRKARSARRKWTPLNKA
ncbi:hypothetical protein BDV11DRAFT_6624 [Aspergillus similis]